MVIKTCLRATSSGEQMINFSFSDKGKTTMLSSGIRISGKKNFKNGQIVNEPNAAYNNAKILQQLIDHQKAYDSLSDGEKTLGITDVVKLLSSKKKVEKSEIFVEFAQLVIDEYRNRGKGSWEIKHYAILKFKEKYADVSIVGLNRTILENFIEYLRKAKLSETTVSMYLREIQTIYHKAQEKRLVSRDDDPFFKFKIPKWNSRDVALTVEQVKTMQNIEVKEKMQGVARDVFMTIFYLGGINMKDLMNLEPATNGRISYLRIKTEETKAEKIPVSLAVTPELQRLIDKYKGESTLFDFGYKYSRYQDFTSLVNRNLKKVAEKAGINVNLTTYVARHSWATIADELGVDINVIEYVLGQSAKGRVVFQYMHRRNKAADEAIRRVLDALL